MPGIIEPGRAPRETRNPVSPTFGTIMPKPKFNTQEQNPVTHYFMAHAAA